MQVVIEIGDDEIEKLKEAIGDFDETEKYEIEFAIKTLIQSV